MFIRKYRYILYKNKEINKKKQQQQELDNKFKNLEELLNVASERITNLKKNIISNNITKSPTKIYVSHKYYPSKIY